MIISIYRWCCVFVFISIYPFSHCCDDFASIIHICWFLALGWEQVWFLKGLNLCLCWADMKLDLLCWILNYCTVEARFVWLALGAIVFLRLLCKYPFMVQICRFVIMHIIFSLSVFYRTSLYGMIIGIIMMWDSELLKCQSCWNAIYSWIQC